ncbi:nickel/cobalt ABC transporter permease [Staphylococcus pasteuri]|uniref:nickel/cobalt ABC transporter permease n=1 Tax=Staphylococcus TaxID=1279 RepID=UPI000868B261|nr:MULTISPECIES: nickel/cobalt ABC transporter permease [Staphylococcus]ODB69741.1 nickel ABC transporter permease subunit NikB [Staphylococcus sp. AOAB]RQX28291.1 ABC transporter permease [Staphylococcus warneri]MCO0861532.1 ABC transporter permease [Staphylococcus pasteuri]MCO5360027.1 ABC transporter permease [Staphylococcus pasteuri]OFV12413.1 nickel ABC transporter permease subunit NikB [Staphylococcus sp. HMSC13A10]
MFKLIIKRIALMFPLLIVVSFMTFMMTYLSNEDPAVTILHAQGTPNVTEQLITETKKKYGLDAPILIQYKEWLQQAIQFKFGTSYITGDPVSERIGPAFMNTLKLTLISSLSVMVTSIFLGVVSALTRGRSTDRVIRLIAFFLTALPSYWVASMLIIFVSVKLNLLPTSGLTGPESYILPVVVITMTYTGIYFRNVRRAMIEQLNEEYVMYLKASGVYTITLLKHVLRNALQVAVSIFCMSIPMIMGGLVVVENVFAWPGLGQLSIKAIVEHDFPVIQAYVLIVAVLFIVFNTLADIINALLNPRLREATR